MKLILIKIGGAIILGITSAIIVYAIWLKSLEPLSERFNSVYEYKAYLKSSKEDWRKVYCAEFLAQSVFDVPLGISVQTFAEEKSNPYWHNYLKMRSIIPPASSSEYILPSDIVIFSDDENNITFGLKKVTLVRLESLSKNKYYGYIETLGPPPFEMDSQAQQIIFSATHTRTASYIQRLWWSIQEELIKK